LKDLQNILKDKVTSYSFDTFDDSVIKPVGEEEIIDLDLEQSLDLVDVDEELEAEILSLEKSIAKNSEFIISPIVKEHRGFNKQELDEKERRINNEVERRIEVIGNKAYRKGYQEGQEQAREEVFKQTRAATEEKLTTLSSIISEALENEAEVFNQQKQTLYKLVNNLVKWITLRELKNDGDYIERLCEKLIRELQVKSNILVKVDSSNFDKMPEVLDHLNQKLGEIENVRVEVDYEIEGPGIIIESQNGIINGTLKEQFNSLDKLFRSVGLENDEHFDVNAFFAGDYEKVEEPKIVEESNPLLGDEEILDDLIAKAETEETDSESDDEE
jgi:flagellar assembly protein FliH